MILAVITDNSENPRGLTQQKCISCPCRDRLAVDWETLLPIVIQGPKMMEVVPSLTGGFCGYFNVPSVSSPQTGERANVEGYKEAIFGQTTFRQLGWVWARNVDPCWLLPSNNSSS